MTRAEQVLRLNGVTLSDGAGAVTHDGGFTLETLAADASFGHAEPLRVSLATGLLDGEVVEVTGYGNREDMYYQVRVRAADAEGLALGGKLLEEITGRPGELEWTPPAAFGETTVYDVATSDLEWLFDDMDETPQGQRMPMRVFGLRIEAHPFGRPVEPIVVPAVGSGEPTPPPVPVETVIYDGEFGGSNWSHSGGGFTDWGSLGGTGVMVGSNTTGGTHAFKLTWNPDFDMGSDTLIAVKASIGISGSAPIVLKYKSTSSFLTVTATHVATLDGWLYFQTIGGTVTSAELSATVTAASGMHTALYVEGMKHVSGMPFAGSAKQLFRSFEVHSTRRTTGSLHLSHQDQLGPVVAYCATDDGSGYQPSTRTFKTASGSDLADPTAMTGMYNALGPSASYEVQIPRRALPAGTYSIWAWVRSPVEPVVGFTLEFQPVGGAISMPTKRLPHVEYVATPGAWQFVHVGRMTVAAMPNANADAWEQRIRIIGAMASPSLEVDDVQVFNHTTGSLVILDDVPTRHLWIDAPTVQSPWPKMYAGNEPDRSDAAPIGSLAKRWDVLGMPPGQMNIFTALGVPNGAVAAEYFPRVGHNVYKIEVPA